MLDESRVQLIKISINRRFSSHCYTGSKLEVERASWEKAHFLRRGMDIDSIRCLSEFDSASSRHVISAGFFIL